MRIDFLILGATSLELSLVRSALSSSVTGEPGPWSAQTGRIEHRSVAVVETGIGMVNSAAGLTFILTRHRPALILMLGCAGAYPESGLDLCDLAVASEEIYGETGIRTRRKWKDWQHTGLPLLEEDGHCYYNRFPVDPDWRDRALRVAQQTLSPDSHVSSGPFLTVSQVSADAWAARRMALRFKGTVAENMEGAAAAHVALRFGIPFLEVRGISNSAGNRNKQNWKLREAAQQSERVALSLIGSY
ncbi:MAG: futalosine hydrolase [Deltaproteobacteria bacterium]|nr:futalosine hydrolase [Deltaproteobacteria bacterium]